MLSDYCLVFPQCVKNSDCVGLVGQALSLISGDPFESLNLVAFRQVAADTSTAEDERDDASPGGSQCWLSRRCTSSARPVPSVMTPATLTE